MFVVMWKEQMILVSILGCALVEPGCLWHLTFTLGTEKMLGFSYK